MERIKRVFCFLLLFVFVIVFAGEGFFSVKGVLAGKIPEIVKEGTGKKRADGSVGKESGERKEKEEIRDGKDSLYEGVKKNMFPLSLREAEEIKELSERYKKIMEGEKDRVGLRRVIYYDPDEIPRINVSVGYATTVCVWKELDKSGFAVSRKDFVARLAENRRCVVVFPKREFVGGNLVLFVDGKPVTVVLKETYDRMGVDLVVEIEKRPYVEPYEFLRMFLTGDFRDDVKAVLRKELVLDEEKARGILEKWVFEGEDRLEVLKVKRENVKRYMMNYRACIEGENYCFVVKKVALEE